MERVITLFQIVGQQEIKSNKRKSAANMRHVTNKSMQSVKLLWLIGARLMYLAGHLFQLRYRRDEPFNSEKVVQ